MNASQAAVLSQHYAAELARKEAQEKATREAQERLSKKKQRHAFLCDLDNSIRATIQYRVKDGHRTAEHTLHRCNWHTHSIYENFFKHHEHAREVRVMMRYLKRNGYKVEVKRVPRQIDDSAAYLNSGGECGSKDPYWVYDVVMEISW